jgi:hypothetical protein
MAGGGNSRPEGTFGQRLLAAMKRRADPDAFDVVGPQPTADEIAEANADAAADQFEAEFGRTGLARSTNPSALVVGEDPEPAARPKRSKAKSAPRRQTENFQMSGVARLMTAEDDNPAFVAKVADLVREQLAAAVASGQPFGLIVGEPEGVSITGMLTIDHLRLAYRAAAEALTEKDNSNDEI